MDEHSERWASGAVLMLAGIVEIVLLALHPESSAHDFAGMLREEANGRLNDALVHGGFIVLLAVQLVGYRVLSLRLGADRTSVLAAGVFFTIGTAVLGASLFVDGLLIPKLAYRFAGATAAQQDAARPIFALAGAAIGLLMPIGLAFQGIGVVAWSIRLLGLARVTGSASLLLGLVILSSAIGLTANPMFVAAAIPATALWSGLGGILLWRRTL
jgi:hypothetical protein